MAVGTSTPVDWVWEGSAIVLARYATNGSLDQSFGDGGKRITIHGVDNSGAAVAIQGDGKIVVAGSGSDPGDGAGRALLARYEAGSTSGTAPANSTPPTISGTAAEGQTLTANAGAWTGSTPINHSYQWRRCDSAGANCVDIAAATAATYALAAADVGHTIRVRETATNAYGEGSVDSAATAVIKANPGRIAGTVRAQRTTPRSRTRASTAAAATPPRPRATASYSIANVASGSYSCTASANRYGPATRAVHGLSGQTATANFSLARR